MSKLAVSTNTKAFTPVPMAFSDAVAKAFALNLTDIRLLMKQLHTDWTEERLDTAILWYRRFLAMNAAEPGVWHITTQDVDDVWHAHVLSTVLYFEHCAQLFGYYLHHNPVIRDGRDPLVPYAEAYNNTMAKMKELFGETPPIYGRPQFHDELSPEQMVCSGNGGCDSDIGPELSLLRAA